MIRPRILLFSLTLLLTILFAVGCPQTKSGSGGGDDPNAQKGGTIVVGVEQEPPHLNLLLEGGEAIGTAQVAENIIPGLFRLTPDYRYEPYLLKEEPTVENGGVTESPFTVKYELRDDVQWDDEKPITSTDIEFTWKTIMDPDNKILGRTGYDLIQSIETPDDQTAIVTFKSPFAGWRDLFSKGALGGVLPEHLLKGKDFNEQMIRSIDFSGGPFIFEEWNTGNSITLVRNKDYWGRQSYLDKVVFKFVPDSSTLREQLRNEEVDLIIPSPDVDLVEQLEKLPSVKVETGSGTLWEQLAMNNSKPPLSDVNVRKGIAYAIDRQAIVSELLKGHAKTLQSVVVPTIKKFTSPTFEEYNRDLSKSNSALEKSGYVKGADGFYAKGGKRLEVKLSTTAKDPGREKVEQLMVENLADAGISAKIVNAEQGAFFDKVQAGDFELGIWAWSQSPDPSLTSIFASDQIGEGQNVYQYRNAEVTALLHQSDTQVDDDKRAESLKKAQRLIANDAPILPLFQRLDIMAHTDALHGPEVNTTPATNMWNMADWWVEGK